LILEFRLPNADLRVCDGFFFKGQRRLSSEIRKSKIGNDEAHNQ
jgi:hypothetical protein